MGKQLIEQIKDLSEAHETKDGYIRISPVHARELKFGRQPAELVGLTGRKGRKLPGIVLPIVEVSDHKGPPEWTRIEVPFR